jgi:membrane protein DedA with SNARE-associated domain/rhodanese-related sulfurtransferase
MDLVELLTRWDVLLVFSAVLLEQGGFPLPAAPILVSAGALAQTGVMRPEHILLTAFAACFVADQAWFLAGRRFGRRVLAGICRFSLSPDTCVRATDDLISRHGPVALLVAKFIPGVSAVAIPTVAAMGLSYRRFLLFDSLGCLIWGGAYIGTGMIFSREVTRLLDSMSVIGGWSIIVLAGFFALYVVWKLLHRMRLKRLHRLVRISPDEFALLLEGDLELVILDARSSLAREEDPRRLPHSIFLDDLEPTKALPLDAHAKTIVTFCTCPNEASAALLAEKLIRGGYKRVRVLTGGADALALLATSNGSSDATPIVSL